MNLVANAARGALAGTIATVAMDALWYRRYRVDGGENDIATWEFGTEASDFGEDVPAPARVGKRIAEAVGVQLPASAVAMTNNVVHWMTGIGWGKAAGVVAGAVGMPPLGVGIATGVAAWATSYAVLGVPASTDRSPSTTWRRCGRTSVPIWSSARRSARL